MQSDLLHKGLDNWKKPHITHYFIFFTLRILFALFSLTIASNLGHD
jgi:hypothetical protein